MDNTQGLGAAMEESWQRDQAKSQEKRIQTLESQVQYLMRYVEQLSANQVASHNFAVNHGYSVAVMGR